MQESDISVEWYIFHKEKLWLSQKKNQMKRYDICDIMITSNLLYLTVLLNQLDRQRSKCA